MYIRLYIILVNMEIILYKFIENKIKLQKEIFRLDLVLYDDDVYFIMIIIF